MQSSASNIYLNLTTKEGKEYTVELTGEGFQVVSDRHDSAGAAGESKEEIFETPYALLNRISPEFTQAFGQSLCAQLGKVQQGEQTD